jgi:hypothetical protein
MKQLFSYALFLLLDVSTLTAYAQQTLAGTAWQGIARVPERTAVVFQFKQDTVRMFDQASRAVLETMVYATHAHQFTWRKVSGGSPCDAQTPGTYAYRIEKARLFLTLVTDACDARSGAFDQEPLQKVLWPAP